MHASVSKFVHLLPALRTISKVFRRFPFTIYRSDAKRSAECVFPVYRARFTRVPPDRRSSSRTRVQSDKTRKFYVTVRKCFRPLIIDRNRFAKVLRPAARVICAYTCIRSLSPFENSHIQRRSARGIFNFPSVGCLTLFISPRRRLVRSRFFRIYNRSQ